MLIHNTALTMRGKRPNWLLGVLIPTSYILGGELLSYAGKTFIDQLMNAGVNVVYEELDNGLHDIIAIGAKSDAAKDAWKRIGNYVKSQSTDKSAIA